MACTLDVSRLAKSGESSTCHTIDGTPPKLVTSSRSMSSRARSGSHLYMITSLPPKAVLATSTEWQPEAWKNGTESKYAFWVDAAVAAVAAVAADGSSCLPLRMADRFAAKIRLSRLVQMLRWVPRAPLGR